MFRLVYQLLLFLCYCDPQWVEFSAGEIDDILSSHNSFRQRYNIPPLKWQPQLARRARTIMCESKHSSGEDRSFFNNTCVETRLGTCETIPANGENIAIYGGVTGYLPMEKYVKLWTENELPNWDCLTDSKIDPQGKTVGHLTQVLWQTTEFVGCSLSMNCPGMKTQMRCLYARHGNIGGARSIPIENCPKSS